MTKEEAKKWAELFTAFIAGKTIEYKTKEEGDECWSEATIEIWGFEEFDYRIKPETRPFKDAHECWSEVQKHQPLGWVKVIDKGYYCLITDITHDGVYMGEERASYDNMLDNYLFVDGSRFGIVEE